MLPSFLLKYLTTRSWCCTFIFLNWLPTRSWCYAVSFSSSFQHTLDTTVLSFSSNFQHALDATLTFSQIMSNLGTCWLAQESHSAQKNNQACQTSHSFFHHGKKLVRKGFQNVQNHECTVNTMHFYSKKMRGVSTSPKFLPARLEQKEKDSKPQEEVETKSKE